MNLDRPLSRLEARVGLTSQQTNLWPNGLHRKQRRPQSGKVLPPPHNLNKKTLFSTSNLFQNLRAHNKRIQKVRCTAPWIHTTQNHFCRRLFPLAVQVTGQGLDRGVTMQLQIFPLQAQHAQKAIRQLVLAHSLIS